MKQLLTLTLIFSLSFSYGQKTKCHIDLDSIKSIITNPKSENFYDSLLVRFANFDTTLTYDQYDYLYYGNFFYKGYSPYSKTKTEEKFISLYKKEKYKKAIELGHKALKENPINITLINRMAICYRELEMHELGKKYAFNQYEPLLDVIFNSCNSDTVFIVIKIADEYRVMIDMDVDKVSQSLSGNTDIITLQKNEQGISNLYFDVSLPMSYLRRKD